MTLETGVAKLTVAKSDALNLYIKKSIAKKIGLKEGDVKVIWDTEKEELTVKGGSVRKHKSKFV